MTLQIAIHGTGPVANALALWLLREGLSAGQIRLLDAQGQTRAVSSEAESLPQWLGDRALALGLGSLQLLSRICRPIEQAPIESVEISMLGSSGRTVIDRADHRTDKVGAVVRYSALMHSLQQALTGVAWQNTESADPPLPEGHIRIIVHAEGRIEAPEGIRDFGQSALLADIHCEGAAIHHGQAFERFTAEGPLAMLPVTGANLWTLVWCASRAATEARMSAGAQVWLAELGDKLGARFGRLRLANTPTVSPLVRKVRRSHLEHSKEHVWELWIGNAAQQLHPVAGQGLNLGLRDAFELAQSLGTCASAGHDEVARCLERYARQRSVDQRELVGITDSLATVFTLSPLRPVQSAALHGLTLLPPVKSFIARHLMFGRRIGT
jgi:2-octaprenyl-6-methoxyphenol hydroxylase